MNTDKLPSLLDIVISWQKGAGIPITPIALPYMFLYCTHQTGNRIEYQQFFIRGFEESSIGLKSQIGVPCNLKQMRSGAQMVGQTPVFVIK